MPRFIAAHTMPVNEEAIMKFAKEMPSQLPPGVIWKLTYCDFPSNKFFCEWEAPNKEAIEQVFKAAEIPFDAIYAVRLLDVAKAELES
jgi:hypothetical protein